MRGKQSQNNKQKNSKAAVVGRATEKKAATKVVNVKLAAKSATKKAAPSTKAAAAKATPAEKRVSRAKGVSAQVEVLKVKSTKGKGKRREYQSQEKTTPAVEETTTAVLTPSTQMLKTFRKATARSRKLALQASKAKAGKGEFLAKPPKKGKSYRADLRVHSPGTRGYFSTGGVEPGAALVRLAKTKGLDVIAVTDSYNANFVDCVREVAKNSSVDMIPGLELRCRIGDCEEGYLIALFPEDKTSADLFEILTRLGVPQSEYGNQDYILQGNIREVVEIIESAGGLVIPSRMDKTPYRQLAIPTLVEEFGIHAFDLVHPENTDFFKDRWPDGKFTFFTFSNANALAQLGSRTAKIKMEIPGFQGLQQIVARRN